jgi:hypothetical protein
MPASQMVCDDRIKLANEYADASALYYRAVVGMRNGSGTRDAANEAKAKCDQARVALWEHKERHGC